MYDLIIAGGGPAGLTAAIYGTRAMLKTLIIEKSVVGGLMAVTDKLENYPGHESISGGDLSQIMEKQAKSFGTEFKAESIKKISKDGDVFNVETDNNSYEAKSVVYAAGSTPRPAGVKGEKEFIGRGVSYCAVCDAAFYRNLKVAVIGGGDSALKEAVFLTKFASQVTIIHRRQGLRAEKIVQQEAKRNEKISFMLDCVVEEISGSQFVEKVKVKNVITGEVTEESFDGVFVFIGYEPHTEPVTDLVDLTDKGKIIVNSHMETKTQGLFAAGDITDKLVNQVATAVGDGATAGTAAEHYLANKAMNL